MRTKTNPRLTDVGAVIAVVGQTCAASDPLGGGLAALDRTGEPERGRS